MQSVLLFFAFYSACIILSFLVWFQLKDFAALTFIQPENIYKIGRVRQNLINLIIVDKSR